MKAKEQIKICDNCKYCKRLYKVIDAGWLIANIGECKFPENYVRHIGVCRFSEGCENWTEREPTIPPDKEELKKQVTEIIYKLEIVSRNLKNI